MRGFSGVILLHFTVYKVLDKWMMMLMMMVTMMLLIMDDDDDASDDGIREVVHGDDVDGDDVDCNHG